MSLSKSFATLAQQDIKNAKGHLKMIVAAHSGMFRGVASPPHHPRHLQFMALKLSPGYACELLTRLSLKNAICRGPSCTNSNTASFETWRKYLINLCLISCSLLQMGARHTEWRVNGLESTVSPYLQALCNCFVLSYVSSCFYP